jgi:hypothetical protein
VHEDRSIAKPRLARGPLMDRPSQRFRPRTGACKPGSARCIKSGGTHRSLKSPTCTSCVFISARAAGIRSSGIVFVADEALSAPLPLIEYMPPPLGHNHVSCAGWGSFCTLFTPFTCSSPLFTCSAGPCASTCCRWPQRQRRGGLRTLPRAGACLPPHSQQAPRPSLSFAR